MAKSEIKIKQVIPQPTYLADLTQNEANPEFLSDSQRASPLSWLYFTYAYKLVKAGYQPAKMKDSISPKDIISFPWSRRADTLSALFSHQLEMQKRKSSKEKPSLSIRILKTVKWSIITLTIVQTAFVFVRIYSAGIVKKLIDCYTDPNTSKGESYKWTGIRSACLVL